MTAQPQTVSDADEWRGQWVNFYQYRHGQRHFGQTITASREAADEVRAAWFAQAEREAPNGLLLALHLASHRPFWLVEEFDRIPDESLYTVKARNCTFAIAVPYVPPEGPQDDDIPF